jgi:hypothetical protein
MKIMIGTRSRTLARYLAILGLAALLGACGTTRYTVDDGRPVNEKLLSNIRLLGQGERVLRPAIARSGKLQDPDCSTQWELPFSVATSYEWDEDDRVAWVRGLQVDERLTVIGADPACGLEAGDKLVDLDGYSKKNSEKMLKELIDLRDSGDPFPVKTASGKTVTITPFKVCRGYTRLAPVEKPTFQDFHWLISTHPLEIFNPKVTPDEALWMVLWTQGLSEEGGIRMKSFHYTKEFALTMIDIASIAMGVNGAAQAAKVAANQALTAASAAATKAASEAAAKQILEEAAKAAAKEYAQRFGEEMAKTIGKQTTVVLRDTFMARLGMSVSSLSWVATTVFDDADAWAFERMIKLGADPVAGATLHRKLLDRGLISNAFALDEERLGSLALFARKNQREDILMAAFRGASLDPFSLQLTELPSASASTSTMELASDSALSHAPAGLDPATDMTLQMPTESEAR